MTGDFNDWSEDAHPNKLVRGDDRGLKQVPYEMLSAADEAELNRVEDLFKKELAEDGLKALE